jgi:hypothetical protein
MKEVTRYQCEFCNKDFKTPNRHYCKMNPALKNCFTCKHLDGWGESDYSEHPIPAPICKVELDHDWDIEIIKECNYNMQCDKWKQRGTTT